MRSNALTNAITMVGILDNLELVLLALVEEAIESVGRELQALGDQAHEGHANGRHQTHVLLVYRSEGREEFFLRPLVGREQVVV